MFFDYPNGQQLINMTIGPPFGDETRTGAGVAGSLDNPWKGIPGGNPFPITPDPKHAIFVPFGPFLSVQPGPKEPGRQFVEPDCAEADRHAVGGDRQLHRKSDGTPDAHERAEFVGIACGLPWV